MKNITRAFFVFCWATTFAFSAIAATKTFVYCSEGSPTTFDPMVGIDGATFNASAQTIYSRLTEFRPGTTTITPGLAESWKFSKDGLTVTFKLRKKVKWHSNKFFKPTRDFNADDVVFSFNRPRLKENPYYLIGSGGNYEYFQSMDMAKTIKDVKKIDDYTVQFILSERNAPFIANLAMSFASIMSAEYADVMLKAKTPDKFETDPIGTGPFVFDSYQKDTQIRYHSFEDYYLGKVKIDKLVFAITTDPTVRAQKLKVGECNLVSEVGPSDLESLRANSKIKVIEREGLNVGYVAMNMEKKPFDNILVRQAFNMALNRKSYIDAIFRGLGSVANNPIPPQIWSFNKNVPEIKYDPEGAKKLLAKAGFPDGFETEMWVLPVSRPYNPAGKKMGEMMQADLAKVGVKLKLVNYDWPTYLEKARHGEHTLIQSGWTGDNGDPDNFMGYLLTCPAVAGGGNYSRWCNKDFDNLVLKAKTIPEQSKRAPLYEKAQLIFAKEMPWVPVNYAKITRAYTTNVKNYVMHPLALESFDIIDMTP